MMTLSVAHDAEAKALPGTAPLRIEGELGAAMVAGIDRFLMRGLDASVKQRSTYWRRDCSSREAYLRSVQPNRERFARIIGVADERVGGEIQLVGTLSRPSLLARRSAYVAHAVRWPVLEGVDAEGLLLEPEGEALANVVALPDCDWTPEMVVGLTEGVPPGAQFARRLAENGCRVLVPVLVDRRDTFSGHPGVRMTNQPHREFVYRPAFQMGRHIIGYEVQKVLAAVDIFHKEPGESLPIGVMGYGEGGLIAFYASAVDTRVDAAVVSGYFGPREGLWSEPIYRNVWALLHEFGDAEIASLILPRTLIIEACRHPKTSGPPKPSGGRTGAAPGVIMSPDSGDVVREVERARALMAGLHPPAPLTLVQGGDKVPGSDAVLSAFLEALAPGARLAPPGDPPMLAQALPDADARMKRQFDQLVEHTQRLMRESPFRRQAFWSKADASSVEAWEKTTSWYRDYLWDEVIGCLPKATMPVNARTRLVFDEAAYRGYEVVLDVYPDVIAGGLLLIPKDLVPGERRPVVVCQHGLEGTPHKAADPQVQEDAYNQYGCRLAERGFVVYAPQNPYLGGDAFRVLQRKANPLKLSVFSFIVRQHERTLEWLAALPFVDGDRIAFYGISYGGKTAVRVPALLPHYCLSICSADFNEWIWKTVSTRYPFTYPFTGEYEMFEFDLGNTFNYAEMSWLIFPRPFMVERGHHDGVSVDEWVAYEYAKTYRHYDLMGLADRTEIEYFDGPHMIHGVGTFAFLHKHLKWPEPEGQ